jgi:hypothetical protein
MACHGNAGTSQEQAPGVGWNCPAHNLILLLLHYCDPGFGWPGIEFRVWLKTRFSIFYEMSCIARLQGIFISN